MLNLYNLIPDKEYRRISDTNDYYITRYGIVFKVFFNKTIGKEVRKIIKPYFRKNYKSDGGDKLNLVCNVVDKMGKKKIKVVNLLVTNAFIGKPKNKQIVIHRDGNPSNLYLENLYYDFPNSEYRVKNNLKKCLKCKQVKKINNFQKRNGTGNNDGYKPYCNVCRRLEYRTLNGLLTNIYSNQLQSSKRRGHPQPEYNKSELKKWIIEQSNFKKLYIDWEKSNWKKGLIPSIDRLDDNLGYSFDNIQLVPWYYNDIRGRKLKELYPEINYYKINTEGVLIVKYRTLKEAVKNTPEAYASGIKRASINNRMNKKAGGYIWLRI